MMSEEEIGQEEEATVETEEEADLEVEEEPTDESEDEESGLSDDESKEAESWGSEGEYLKAHGVEDAEDIDSVVESYKTLQRKVAEMESVQRTEQARPPVEQEKPPSGEGFFPRGVNAKRVASLIESGQIATESAGTYKSLAAMNDAALDPVIDKMENSFNAVLGGMNKVFTALRDESWSKTPKIIKEKFKRADLDRIMDQHLLFDYRKGAEFAAVSGGGGTDFLAELVKGYAPQQETTKKKLPKFSGARRAAPVNTGAGKWAKFLDRNGVPDKQAVSRLSLDDQGKFWGFVIKREKSKG